jgi:hypothetical protein
VRPRKYKTGLPAYVRIKHGSYHYRGKKICRVDEGEARMYELLSKFMRDEATEAIPALVERFKKFHLRHLSPSAKKEHARLLDVFADEFGDFTIAQVTAPDVRKSCENLYADKPTAARAYKARISTFFQWSIAVEGLRADNPCREIWLRKPRSKPMLWTPELFWQMHDRLAPMQQCYHELSFLLYQRTTDVRTLQWSQVLNDVIRFAPSKVQGSTGAMVDIPLTPAIRKVLARAAEIKKQRAIDNSKIVPNEFVIDNSDGEAYTRSGIYSAYLRADAELHGDKAIGLNPKALLRFACQQAERRGYTVRQIQIGRAHADSSTTEGYLRADSIPVSEVMQELPERIKPEEGT